ncbi:hypothetical protein ACGFNU_38835 [Spirillospora sp. NPDC048911]|uniref:hypothetical protein n=1 Tax=Spirillospora sp. NPDC048911 TaxID=3364527 RepID=UPI0037233CD0
MYPPERLLAAAVAALPERRREWGRAMLAELAGIETRSARWRFAFSIFPVFGLTLGVIGAGLGARTPRPPAAQPPT